LHAARRVTWRPSWAPVCVGAAILVVYWDVVTGLTRQWATDQDYSHAFLVPPLAAYFAYQRRARLQSAAVRPTAAGLLVVAAGLITFAAGVAAADLFLARVSLLPVIAGCVLFLFGFDHIRILAFPLAFLLLMIPLPAIVFNDVTLPLQLLASQAGELVLRAAGIPVLRDGNVLELVGLRLEVAEACSGIRSLLALITFAITVGQFGSSSTLRVCVLIIATLPIAIATNAARVAGTGLAAHVWGPVAAQGFLHTASGAIAFAGAVLTLVGFERGIRRNVLRMAA